MSGLFEKSDFFALSWPLTLVVLGWEEMGVAVDAFVTKGKLSTFWPESWSQQEGMENIAFAFKNKEKTVQSGVFEAKSIDGSFTIEHKIISGGKISSAYPKWNN